MRLVRTLLACGMLTLVASGVARGESTPLPPAALLQKLSLKLRGRVATAAETASFVQRVNAAPDRFHEIYDAEVRAHLDSPEFKGVVETLHAIWWRLPRAESTAFAAFVVANDRPYFEIFDRTYMLLEATSAARYRDAQIQAEGPLPDIAGDWRVVRLAESETRFRSVLSDLDFLNQYPDTATNRNRARANHMFRTFLCETLTPSTPPVDEPPPPGDDPHGADPDCVGCHYRLDPLARFFDGWRPPLPLSNGTWFDATQSSAGKLIVRDGDQPPRTYAGVGESELGKILKSDPKVHACVAKRAWDAVFGLGVKLTPDVETTLVEALDRRSNYKDLMHAVVDHPYFWSTDEAPSLRFADIKEHFAGCGGSCHKLDGTISPKFDPQAYPFRADAAENVALMKQIWGAVNHMVGYKPMPRAPRPKLPSESLQQIRDWITSSALDDLGNATLNDAQIREVLDE